MLQILALFLVFKVASSFIVDAGVFVVDAQGRTLNHFSSRSSLFGPGIPEKGVAGHIVYAFPPDACSEIVPAPKVPDNQTRWIVLIRRNECSFVKKTPSELPNLKLKLPKNRMVQNAQKAGFVAAIVHNVDSDVLVPMSGESGSVAIPSVFVGSSSASVLLKYNFSLSHHIQLEPFDYNYSKLLWPFVLVLAICMTVLLLFTIVKCVVNQVRKCMSRVSPSTLRKLPIKKFNKGDRYDTCAICLEEYEAGDRLRVLPCSHTFHQKCIDPWLTKNKRTCPLCKKKAFARPGNSSHSDSDDSAEDGYVSRRSSERTPLLSARDTATRPSTDYGVVTSINQSAAAVSAAGSDEHMHGAEVDDVPSLSGTASSQVWQLSSSVEVHRASGPDSDEEEENHAPASGPEARATADFPLQEVEPAGTENPVFYAAETEVVVGELVTSSNGRDADQDISFDRSGGAVV